MSLRRFRGWEPVTRQLPDGGTKPEPEFTSYERALWRALAAYEADLCPGCGQPMSQSLFDAAREAQPVYVGAFMSCLGCEAIHKGMDGQRITDQIEQARLDAAYQARPELAPHVSTGHRRWFAMPKEDS